MVNTALQKIKNDLKLISVTNFSFDDLYEFVLDEE